MTTWMTTDKSLHLARELLANTPQILRQHRRLLGTGESTVSNPVPVLLSLMDRCTEGDADSQVVAQQLLQAAASLRPSPVPDAAAWNAMLGFDRTGALRYDALIGDVVKISAAPYQLFDDLLDNFRPHPTPRFNDIDILSCQHILGSILPQLVAIRRLLPRARFWEIIGKPYSAHPWVVRSLDEYNFQFDHESAILPDRTSDQGGYRLGMYKQQHRQVVRASVQRFFNLMDASLKTSDIPILVIDDGGALIDAVGRIAKQCGTTRPIVCVEQTQRGLYAAHPVSEPRNAPAGGLAVVNVAQTLSKLVLESPLIARSVVENLFSWIELLNSADCDDAPSEDLQYGVIGFGSVGEAVASEFRARGIDAEIYDLNNNRRAAAKRQGYEVALNLDELLNKADVLVAATNGSWLDSAHAGHLRDGVILASASSGDGEFDGLPEWKSDQLSILDSSLPNRPFDNIHGEIRLQRPDGAVIHVLNGGFPVNFNGAIDPIGPYQIQLTRALMLAGVLQSIGFEESDQGSPAGMSGVFDLENSLDRFLFERYERISGSS